MVAATAACMIMTAVIMIKIIPKKDQSARSLIQTTMFMDTAICQPNATALNTPPMTAIPGLVDVRLTVTPSAARLRKALQDSLAERNWQV